MEYNKIKNAEELINNSRYLIKNPENSYLRTVFENHKNRCNILATPIVL